VFLPTESFFLRGRNDFAVANKTRGAIVVESRYAEDIQGRFARNVASWAAATFWPVAFKCWSSAK
jgi:hypothetical protein